MHTTFKSHSCLKVTKGSAINLRKFQWTYLFIKSAIKVPQYLYCINTRKAF